MVDPRPHVYSPPPLNGRRMSLSGGIVLWFFFWWILIPAYLLIGAFWAAVFLVGNAFTLIIVPFVAMILVPAVMSTCRASVRASQRGYRAVLERRTTH